MSDYPILSGAEPLFVEGNEIGCLVSHGFTGSPQSMRFLGEYLAREAGFTVSVPRLPGLGTAPEDMQRRTASDWTGTIQSELERLAGRCKHVFTLGLSMGGTLALHTAASFPDIVRGTVAINAPVFLNNPDMASLAFNSHAPEFIPGIGADIKDPEVTELAYEQVPVASISQLYGLVYVTQSLLPRLDCPLLAFHSDEDHVVDPANGDFLMEKAGTAEKTLVRLDNSFHVATIDHDKERIASESLAFIRRCVVEEA